MNTAMITTANPLNNVIALLKKVSVFNTRVKEKSIAETYDLWSENYEAETGNLMTDMDESIFTELLKSMDLKGKTLADIGCGTGRHWPKLLKGRPRGITGFDVSAGLLRQLEEKFPETQTN